MSPLVAGDDKVRLRDRVAIVTGGGRGIGRGIALGYAREGADVVIVSRTLAQVEEVAQEVRNMGRRSLALQIDVSNPDDVARMTQKTMKTFGRIDVLVNNAGVFSTVPSLELPLIEWQKCLDINLTGVFLCSQAVGREMIKAGQGTIINIASILSFVAFPARVAYAASKGGVVQLTKVLGIEWAPHGVTVNAIAPGMIRTEIAEEQISKKEFDLDEIAHRTPLRRMGDVQDVVGTAIFLASEEARFITGETIIVDGGWVPYGYL